ncbi:MAG: hypothetical protein PQJ59_00580 [Spirochaetales bacterium]|nr:hypothetical protein [Spirochaetales bacterium]
MGQSNRLSVIYSNLKKAAEKQQNFALVTEYERLSEKNKEEGVAGGTLAGLLEMVSSDLVDLIPKAADVVKSHGDRGGQRALKWGETVTKIQKSLMDRYLKKGDEAFEGKDFYVCQACGFIYSGTEAPKLCAACKAPSDRFEKIK